MTAARIATNVLPRRHRPPTDGYRVGAPASAPELGYVRSFAGTQATSQASARTLRDGIRRRVRFLFEWWGLADSPEGPVELCAAARPRACLCFRSKKNDLLPLRHQSLSTERASLTAAAGPIRSFFASTCTLIFTFLCERNSSARWHVIQLFVDSASRFLLP